MAGGRLGPISPEVIRAISEGLAARHGESEDPYANYDSSHEAVIEAIRRKKLTALFPGTKLRQKKLGIGYNYSIGDRDVYFVRYLSEVEQALCLRKSLVSSAVESVDVILTIGVDRNDGELVSFLASSEFFERVLTPGEKMMAEVEAEEAAKKS